MLLPSAVHVFSIFDFGAVFHDCLSEDPQGNPPFSPFFGAPSMLLASVVHVSYSIVVSHYVLMCHCCSIN